MPSPDLAAPDSPDLPAAVPDDGRAAVLTTSRRRAELRRANAEMREELERLAERVHHHEATARHVHAMLRSIEARSGELEARLPGLLLREFRSFDASGRELIAACIAVALTDWEEREQGAHLREENRRRFAAREEARVALRREEARYYDVRDRLDGLWQERRACRAPWRYFRRRALDRRIASARRESAAIEATLAVARMLVETLDAEPTPALAGLSVAARREVNLMGIAAAEELVHRLGGSSIPRLAAAAMALGRLPDGSVAPADCSARLADARRARALLLTGLPLAECAAARMPSLRSRVRYAGDGETVPLGDPSGTPGDGAGEGPAATLDVLRDDAWGLSQLMVR